jgi:hypothetical protein
MDDKFDEALEQVTKSMQQMASKPDGEDAKSVKPPPSEDPSLGFSELNEKLEKQFGSNLKTLQDSLAQVSNDIKANK